MMSKRVFYIEHDGFRECCGYSVGFGLPMSDQKSEPWGWMYMKWVHVHADFHEPTLEMTQGNWGLLPIFADLFNELALVQADKWLSISNFICILERCGFQKMEE